MGFFQDPSLRSSAGKALPEISLSRKRVRIDIRVKGLGLGDILMVMVRVRFKVCLVHGLRLLSEVSEEAFLPRFYYNKRTFSSLKSDSSKQSILGLTQEFCWLSACVGG